MNEKTKKELRNKLLERKKALNDQRRDLYTRSGRIVNLYGQPTARSHGYLTQAKLMLQDEASIDIALEDLQKDIFKPAQEILETKIRQIHS